MSDPEEDEDNMPDNKDSTHEGEGETEAEPDVVEADIMVVDVDRDNDGETGGEDEEEDSSDGLRAGGGLRERPKWRRRRHRGQLRRPVTASAAGPNAGITTNRSQ